MGRGNDASLGQPWTDGHLGPVEATTIHNVTSSPPSALISLGIQSHTLYGSSIYGGVAATGIAHGFTGIMDVENSASDQNEHSLFMGWQRYGHTAKGRAWFTDWSLHGSTGTRLQQLDGITMFVNNYWNGQPIGGSSAGQWIVTRPDAGGGAEGAHLAANTYAVGVGLGIVGFAGRPDSSGTKTTGFTVGIQIGGRGSGWMSSVETSLIGTGITIRDTQSAAMSITGTTGAAGIYWNGATGGGIVPVGTDGIRINNGPSQKLAFYGKTPVVQAAAIAAPTTDPESLQTAINALRTALSNVGITA